MFPSQHVVINWLVGKLCILEASNFLKILSFVPKPPTHMPVLLSNLDLKQAISPDGFIKDAKTENIDGIKL